jgi:hypothetical protein
VSLCVSPPRIRSRAQAAPLPPMRARPALTATWFVSCATSASREPADGPDAFPVPGVEVDDDEDPWGGATSAPPMFTSPGFDFDGNAGCARRPGVGDDCGDGRERGKEAATHKKVRESAGTETGGGKM